MRKSLFSFNNQDIEKGIEDVYCIVYLPGVQRTLTAKNE